MPAAILHELRELEARGHDPERLIKAANLLLRRQFLFSGDRGVAQAYNILTDARCFDYFAAFFDGLGYRLHRNETEQWVGLVPDPELVPLAKMRHDETIVLLLLALVWQESVNDGEVKERAVVETTSGEIFERYVNIIGKERLREGRFKEILDVFRRRSMIAVGEQDPESGELAIEIRSMVRLVAGESALARLKRFAAETAFDLDRQEQSTAAAANPDESGEEPERV